MAITPAELEAELAGLPHEHRAVVLARLVRQVLASKLSTMRERERALEAALDAYHQAQGEADEWNDALAAVLKTIEPARELDDQERAEAARKRVA
jgi:hypothetical protein